MMVGVTHPDPMLEQAWSALGGDPAATASLEVQRPGRHLPARLPVWSLAVATAGSALLAAAGLAEARGARRPSVALDAVHVAAAFRSERAVRLDGAPPGSPFDPLSAFLPAGDGWVRLHGNYPHHRAALRRALCLGPEATADEVRAAVAGRQAVVVEDAVVAAGGCAAAVRDRGAWALHPQGAAVAGEPLVAWSAEAAPAAAAAAAARSLAPLGQGEPPAAGLRVLDLTRVIAGPVGTRTLAALGAEVLRLDPPDLPELPLQVLDTGSGKRSALLDLRTPTGRAALEGLLAGADVLIQGYRPGALAAFGLDPDELRERHPALATVTLAAWGHTGPWRHRRGFDSLVQAATGIAELQREAADPAPGALPAQALDHGTGHLIAAAALRAVGARLQGGAPGHARLSLARTAAWLLAQPAAVPAGTLPDPAPFTVELASPLGRVCVVAPPGRLDGRPLSWARGPVAAGHDDPRWIG
jgi:hypothetical protein